MDFPQTDSCGAIHSSTGTIWQKDGYSWWVARIQYLCNVYDMLRIDHFRGFDSYFAIPYGDANAQRGHWKQGPEWICFLPWSRRSAKQNIMAEDLGYMTDSVKKLLSDSGFPGIKLLQFAFDSRDGGGDMYLPENYPENCVAYTGTHDNDTSVGWVTSAEPEDVKQAFRYLHTDTAEDINWKMMRAIWESAAGLTIVQAQDLPGTGKLVTDEYSIYSRKELEMEGTERQFHVGIVGKNPK